MYTSVLYLCDEEYEDWRLNTNFFQLLIGTLNELVEDMIVALLAALVHLGRQDREYTRSC
jgi:hypothetical protein